MMDLSAQYLARWQSEYTPALNGEEPRMLTEADRAPNPYTGKPAGPVDVRGVKGPKPAGDIAGEGGHPETLIDMAKGAARSAIELFGFPARAAGELAAASAGRAFSMEGASGEGTIEGGGTDPAMHAEVQQAIDTAFEEGKRLVAGEPTEGAQEVEHVLGVPFAILSYPAQKVGEFVHEKTGDPLLGKAAELATLTGTFKAAHAAGKLKAEDLARARELIPAKLMEERGSIEVPGKRDVKPAEWGKLESAISSGSLDIEGKPGRLNYDRMEIPDTVKEVMAGVDALYGKRIEETIGAPRTLEKVYEEAKANPMTVPELLRFPDNEPMTDLDITRARLLHNAVASYTREAAGKVMSGEAEAQGVLDAALALTARIQEKKELTTAAIARGLGSHRIMTEVGDYQAAGLSKFAENLARLKKKGVDGKTVAQAILEMETPEQLAVFARSLQRATKPQMFLEAWINGLLSGPQTHAANMTGNLATLAVLIEERQMAAFLPSWGKEPGVAGGEAGAMAHGAVMGVIDLLRLAAKTTKAEGLRPVARKFLAGEYLSESGKVESLLSKNQQPVRKSITAENLSASGPLGVYVDFAGDVVRSPGTFLGMEDVLFKAMASRAELHAQAYRKASSEGLRGKEFGDRVAELTENPTEEMVLSASEFADYATFTKALGATCQAAQRLINSHPGLKLFVPFFRTPTNIMKFVGERTPLAALSANVRADIRKGGATGQLAMAKLVNGSMIMGAAAYLASAGYITGTGPANKSQRQLWLNDGWQPMSLKIGEEYHDISRLEPIGTLMSIAADIALINEFNQGDVEDRDIEDLAVAAALAGYRVFSSKSYLTGIGGWFNAINDPDRHGGKVFRQLVGSMVPAAVAQGTAAYVDPHIREVRGMVDAAMARIPGASATLEPRLDLFGREVLRPGRLGPDIASPMRVSEAKKDPVLDEMNRLGMAVAMPSRIVMGRPPGGTGFFGVGAKAGPLQGVELKPKEYSIYVRYAGNKFKMHQQELIDGQLVNFGNVGAYDFLKAYMQTSVYKEKPEVSDGLPGSKQEFIKSVIYRYRTAALQLMTEASDRLREIRKKKGEAMEMYNETGKLPGDHPGKAGEKPAGAIQIGDRFSVPIADYGKGEGPADQ